MSKTAKWHNSDESREMSRAAGWVMVRRPGCVPYTMPAKEWDALPSAEDGKRIAADFRRALSEMKP